MTSRRGSRRYSDLSDDNLALACTPTLRPSLWSKVRSCPRPSLSYQMASSHVPAASKSMLDGCTPTGFVVSSEAVPYFRPSLKYQVAASYNPTASNTMFGACTPTSFVVSSDVVPNFRPPTLSYQLAKSCVPTASKVLSDRVPCF